MAERLLYVAAAPFEAARRVAVLPEGHRSRRLHGHSFLAKVSAGLPPGWARFAGGELGQLCEALRGVVADLDYCDLNALLPVPTDENLARWARDRLPVPGVETLAIQSTGDRGVELGGGERFRIWRRFRFEAAHWLPQVPAGHPCGRLHGHGFEVALHAVQDLTGKATGIDFDRLAALWSPLQQELHQVCLNDIAGLENPTSELLARWIWERLGPSLPSLSAVSVYETGTAGCHYDGARFRIWKERRFEAAVRLTKAPDGDPRRRWHGHSYRLRLYLTAPLDDVLGWTLDYGDVKALFQPVYDALDHQCLNDLSRLDDPDPARLALWIREAAMAYLPQLERIDLDETPGCGVSLRWGP